MSGMTLRGDCVIRSGGLCRGIDLNVEENRVLHWRGVGHGCVACCRTRTRRRVWHDLPAAGGCGACRGADVVTSCGRGEVIENRRNYLVR